MRAATAGAVSPDLRPYILVAVATALFGLAVFPLPLSAYISRLNIDDSFYYDQIARNFASGRFSTFDGVHPTNGYHPLWAVMLTPVFALVRDPVLAIRTTKMIELVMLLVASLLVMASGRRAGWPALAVLSVPVAIFGAPVLYDGMETSIQVLLLAGILHCLTRIFVEDDRGISMIALGGLCALLPWARLETLSAGVSAMAVVSLHALATGRRDPRAIVAAWSLLGLSVAGYFIYNETIFGFPVPVSGAVKNYWSSLHFAAEGHASVLGNVRYYYWLHYRRLAESALVLAMVGLPWTSSNYRHGKSDPRHAMDAFVAILLAAYGARLAYSCLFIDPSYDNTYYYVAQILLHALAAAYVLDRALLVVDRLARERPRLRPPVVFVGGAAVLLGVSLQAHPWSLPSQWRRGGAPTWPEASYEGARWIDTHLPKDAVVGSPNSGVLGYFTQRRIVNLDGLVNDAGFFAAMKDQRVESWMRGAKITYLADAVRADRPDGCASIAAGSAQTRPYSGSCKLLYAGLRFRQAWRRKVDEMQFRVYAFSPQGDEAMSPPRP